MVWVGLGWGDHQFFGLCLHIRRGYSRKKDPPTEEAENPYSIHTIFESGLDTVSTIPWYNAWPNLTEPLSIRKKWRLWSKTKLSPCSPILRHCAPPFHSGSLWMQYWWQTWSWAAARAVGGKKRRQGGCQGASRPWLPPCTTVYPTMPYHTLAHHTIPLHLLSEREQMVGMVPYPSIHHHPSPHGRPCLMFRTKKAQKLEEDQTSMLKWNLCNHFSHTKHSLDPRDSLTADSLDCENQTRVPVFLILMKQVATLPSGTKLF